MRLTSCWQGGCWGKSTGCGVRLRPSPALPLPVVSHWSVKQGSWGPWGTWPAPGPAGTLAGPR